jgi:predicted DNA binding CopG/RHH family protein
MDAALGKDPRGHGIRCPTLCEKRMGEQTTMKMPKFKTEAEEAQWVYENRNRLGEEFAQAMCEGKTTRLTREKLLARIEASKAKAVNIRLPEADLQLARALAAKKGLPYQTYIKSLLHEALQREAQR